MYARRRIAPRFNLKVPVRLRRLDQIGSIEHTLLSSNASAGGVYLPSDLQLDIGTGVRVYLVIPEEISGKPEARWCCEGRVVHTHPSDLFGNGRGLGLWFETSIMLPANRRDPFLEVVADSPGGIRTAGLAGMTVGGGRSDEAFGKFLISALTRKCEY
jgi:hypothetical protein